MGGFENVSEGAEQCADLCLVNDQWRRQRNDVAGRSDQDIFLPEAALEYLISACRWLAGQGFKFDCANQANVANVFYMRKASQCVCRLFKCR